MKVGKLINIIPCHADNFPRERKGNFYDDLSLIQIDNKGKNNS